MGKRTGCPQLTPLEDKAGTTICSTSSARVSAGPAPTRSRLALERLGFGPCYHMLEVIRQRDSTARWEHGLSAGPVDWDRVFAGYRSTVDWPGLRVLAVAGGSVPGGQGGADGTRPAIVVCQRKRTIFASEDDGPGPEMPTELDEETLRFVSFMTGELLPAMLDDGRGGRLDELDEERAIQTFLRHNEEVRAGVPADRLLVYDITDGWAPLCEFLDVPVPDEDFPYANDSGSFRHTFQTAFAQRLGLTVR